MEVCPCCQDWGLHTLSLDGYYLCPVCFWEDSAGDDPDQPSIGNNSLTLTVARANYAAFGACERRFVAHVRPRSNVEPPLPEEKTTSDTD